MKASLLNPQRWSRYAYALNNPLRYLDPDGRGRDDHDQPRHLYGKQRHGDDERSEHRGRNNILRVQPGECSCGSQNANKSPIPAGTYTAHRRTDHNPNRVELEGVAGYSNIQVHNGNAPSAVKGCFLAGTSRAIDWVNYSVSAMNSINNIISADGGNISVVVNGSPTAPASTAATPAAGGAEHLGVRALRLRRRAGKAAKEHRCPDRKRRFR